MAHYYNLKHIIDDLKEIERNHLQINSFGTGDIKQLIYLTQDQNKTDNTTWAAPLYPLLYVIPGTITRYENYVNYSLNVIVCDILNAKNYDNEVDVMSDTAQILSDVLAQFKYSVTAAQGNFETKYDIQLPATLIPFNEAFDDILAGWNLQLNVIVDEPLNRCIAPYNNPWT